jgi:hypothetical protein
MLGLAFLKRQLGALLVVDVGDVAVPDDAVVGQLLGGGPAFHPAPAPVAANPVLVLPSAQVGGGGLDRLGHCRQVVRVDAFKHPGGVLRHFFGAAAVDVPDAGAGVGEGGAAVRPLPVLVQHAGRLTHQLGQGTGGDLALQQARQPFGQQGYEGDFGVGERVWPGVRGGKVQGTEGAPLNDHRRGDVGLQTKGPIAWVVPVG